MSALGDEHGARGEGAPTLAAEPTALVTPNPWTELRRHTDARIALGRAGVSQPTAPHLAFQYAHAQARDAVHLPLDVSGVNEAIRALGLEVLPLHSAAASRHTYLQRPDLGRRLDAASSQRLDAWARLAPTSAEEERHWAPAPDGRRFDVVFVVADGLSALAVHRHAAPLLAQVVPPLREAGWCIGPVPLVEQGRVAVADEVGERLCARMVVILIGERPGLSSPDSLGVYLTWAPHVGLTDAARNCISNVRPAGLGPVEAGARLLWLLRQARTREVSGVALKDETDVGGTALTASSPAVGLQNGAGRAGLD